MTDPRKQSLPRLLEAAAEKGIPSPSAVARALNVSDQSVNNWKTRGVPHSMTIEAQRLWGVAAHWISTGEGPKWISVSPLPSSLVLDQAHTSPAPELGESTIRVPLLANAGSMGTGSDVQHEDVLVGHISLSEQWVARRLQPSSSAALRFIHAYGDSMHPTFEDGDVLLVDTGMRDAKTIDGVYVMAANDRVYIKRVRQRMDGVVEISSDNPTVKTVDVLNGDHAIDVLGRVVWCWNGRKL